MLNKFPLLQASFKSLNSDCFKSKTTIKFCNSLNNLSAYNDVHLTWGTVGVGNEKVDELARKGNQMSFHGSEPFVGLIYLAVGTIVRNHFLAQHREYRVNSTTCKHTKNTDLRP